MVHVREYSDAMQDYYQSHRAGKYWIKAKDEMSTIFTNHAPSLLVLALWSGESGSE